MSIAARERPDPKREAGAAIARAQADLESAVTELQRLPALDLHSLALAVQAMTSFLTVTGAVVEMLIPVLRHHPDRQISVWLDGLAHATALMSHTTSQLMNSSASLPPMLRIQYVDVAQLAERACAYYGRTASQNGVELSFRSEGDVPIIRSDRVLLAAVFDSLLTNAVKHSARRTVVRVEVAGDPGGVVCRIHDAAPGATPAADYGFEVAQRFARLLGGTLHFERHGDEGGVAILRLSREAPAV
jgi:signal transduction histidine kinase